MDTHLNGKRKYLIFSHIISHSTAEPNTYHKLKLATEETYTLHFYTFKAATEVSDRNVYDDCPHCWCGSGANLSLDSVCLQYHGVRSCG